MSHYTVLVLGDDPEKQLEPFCEQTEDYQYLEFFDAEKEHQEDYASGKETKKEWYPSDNMWLSHKEYKQLLNTGELSFTKHAPDRYFCGGMLENNDKDRKSNVVRIDRWDEDKGEQRTNTHAEVTYFKKEFTPDIKDNLLKDLKKNPPKEMKDAYAILGSRLAKEKDGFFVYEANIKLIDSPKDIPLKELYPNFSRYLEEWCGYEKDDGEGKYGSWRNPNSKWDWYELGGRWGDFFTLKDGNTSDQAEKSEIDFKAMLDKQQKKAEDLWDETEELIANSEKTGKNIDWELSFQYGRDPKDTREKYIKDSVGLSTFAVLKDGAWYEKGKMGWWATVSDEKDPKAWDRELLKLIETSSEETMFSLYDCHI